MSRKNKRHSPFQAAKPKPEIGPNPPSLNLDFMNAATVVVPEWSSVQFILAGCGGIGGYVAPHLGRLMRVMHDNGKAAQLTLVDPDVVEEKNIGRQNFCDAEIGQPKAIALAQRYGPAWGLNTAVFQSEFDESHMFGASDLIVIIGCVDNAKARSVLNQTLGHNPEEVSMGPPRVWWLDCGNLKDTGRVMLGSALDVDQCEGAFVAPGKVAALPSPALQYPSLLIPGRDEVQDREMSCAELQAANLQSLNINPAVAWMANNMLTRLLVTNDLKVYQSVANLASVTVKSFYCTPEEIAREIDRSVEFVIGYERNEVAA
jgi:PRTRC genetic system ThiF family protein